LNAKTKQIVNSEFYFKLSIVDNIYKDFVPKGIKNRKNINKQK